MGHIYQRGNVWWVKYSRNGKAYYESSHAKVKQAAKALLARREGEIAQGKIPGVVFDKVKFDDLAEDFLRDYRINNKSLARAKLSVRHLRESFEAFPIPMITSDRIQAYVEKRLEAGAANATINRELAALKRMLHMGARQTPPKVDRVPYINMLAENNVRQGFFEHGQFLALRTHLPEYLTGLVTFGYKVGWRISEIANLTWSQVDRQQGIVRLEVGTGKTKEGRLVHLDDELQGIFADQWKRRKRSGVLTPHVFPNSTGTGKISDFRAAWSRACREAGLGYGFRLGKRYVKKWQGKLPHGPIFHDFRRSAVRNMVRAGIPERVAMMISGHKTRSVFERYNVVSDTDLKQAAERQAAYLEAQNSDNSVTISTLSKKKGIS